MAKKVYDLIEKKSQFGKHLSVICGYMVSEAINNLAESSIYGSVFFSFTGLAFIEEHTLNQISQYAIVSFQGVESLWDDCRFIPADWGS